MGVFETLGLSTTVQHEILFAEFEKLVDYVEILFGFLRRATIEPLVNIWYWPFNVFADSSDYCARGPNFGR